LEEGELKPCNSSINKRPIRNDASNGDNVQDAIQGEPDEFDGPIRKKRRYGDPGKISEARRRQVRRRLFTDDYVEMQAEVEELKRRPTIDRIVVRDEILDLRQRLPGYEGAVALFTNIFNTLVYIVQYKTSLSVLKNRKLVIQLRATEHNLRQLEVKNYEGAHIQLPRMLESIFSMLDYRNNVSYINQMRPVSCVLNKDYLFERISFRSMEGTTKNGSAYIELMFNIPFRFIFIGQADRKGQYKKNTVQCFPFFGDYIDRAITDMADVLYELVSKEIKNAKMKLDEEESSNEDINVQGAGVPDHSVFGSANSFTSSNSLQMMEAYSKSKKNRSTADNVLLQTYLRQITLPLAKKNSENINILITSGNNGKQANDVNKISYLIVENDKEDPRRGQLKMSDEDVTEDAIYLSSYIRCRVLMLEQPTFELQIYTRDAIKLMTVDDRLVKFSDFE